MKKAIVLHGWCGHSKNCWFPWLKENLEEMGYETIIPDLPNSDFPVLQEQLDVIEKYAGILSPGDLIIGHSLGCLLALQFIQKHHLQRLHMIFVGPAYPSDTPKRKGHAADAHLLAYRNTPLELTILNNSYTVFLSQDDPFIDLSNAKKFYSQLENVRIVEFQEKGHFNTASNIFELPEILEYIQE